MSKGAYHLPVLLEESVKGLVRNIDGVYVDVTYGGGGHSEAILKMLSAKGKLIAFDRDLDATKNIINEDRLLFVKADFKYIQNHLMLNGIDKVDGILGDFGVSSHQFDSELRGFSIRGDANLDMRMNQKQELTAEKVVNEYSVDDLRKVFKMYGELNNGGLLASEIVRVRSEKRIRTTGELKDLLSRYSGYGEKQKNKFYAKLFQSIRIEVNQELESIRELLKSSVDILKPKGRMVTISYHSLEDRLVKNYFKRGSFDGSVVKDFYGNLIKPFEEINKKPICPTFEEIEKNPRARSAKLRIAEKI